ncbi:hypothetical protein DPMN_117454 [Dreissena polymorpha]|uniref:Uncharacterized protein n=1 Tax=Dreissena polymorpha TaxID=45954 RepID=A0A9D4KQY0_DREPO|nr:hypothetical protein DPMN_117454 [Dreissena polymorpha]
MLMKKCFLRIQIHRWIVQALEGGMVDGAVVVVEVVVVDEVVVVAGAVVVGVVQQGVVQVEVEMVVGLKKVCLILIYLL